MGTSVTIIILIIIVVLAVISSIKRIRHGSACCGTHDSGPKKIRVHDKNKSHYPYTYTLTVDGMHCSNCATHVENALNTKEDVWARVDLGNKTVLVRTKSPMEWNDFSTAIREAGYTLISQASD